MRLFRTFGLAVMVALSLAACSMPGGVQNIPASPEAIASENTLDERLGLAAETAATAAYKSASLFIRYGNPSPATVRKIGEGQVKVRALVKATRDAYDTRNARSYREAYDKANAGIKDFLASF